MRIFVYIIFIFLLFSGVSYAGGVYILGDSVSASLYSSAKTALSGCGDLELTEDIRGIVIRIPLESPEENYYSISSALSAKLRCIEYFLVKIKNPVIIEVHTDKVPEYLRMKNWEFSSVIAGNIGEEFMHYTPKIPVERIYTVGYGEFMPDINTSNNGGKSSNRIDIIILCNKSGE